MDSPLRRICAWCRIDIDTGEPEGVPHPDDTHGICPRCLARVEREWGLEDDDESAQTDRS